MADRPPRATFRLDGPDDAPPTEPPNDGEGSAARPTRPPEPEGAMVAETPGRYVAAGATPELIGVGGIGRVVAMRDEALGREVAIKELLPHAVRAPGSAGTTAGSASTTAGSAATTAGSDSTGASRPSGAVVSRFLREAQITARLEHPGIVPVYELGQRADGTLYYTMRRIRGRTLASALRAATGLDARLQLLGHVVDVCYAIAYAHSRGVVHRDLKPDNVMVGEFGETIVLDWGLAANKGEADVRRRHFTRELERIEAADSRHTLAGTVMGTPSYMSPEQAQGRVDLLDERADIWSLGAVLYELLTGHPPFDGPTPLAVLQQVRTDTPRPVRARAPDAPPELAAIAEKAIARDRDQRYATASELAHDLEAWRSGRRVGAYQYSNWDLLRRFYQRNRVALTIGGVAIVALLTVGLLTHVQVMDERDRAMSAEAEARARAEQARALYADSLAGYADAAWERGDRQRAALWAAGALDMREDPSSRGLALRALDPTEPRVEAILPDSRGCAKLAWSTAGTVACADTDGVRLWAAPDAPPQRLASPNPVRAIAFAPDGATIFAADTSGRVLAWPLPSPPDAPPAWELLLPDLTPQALAVSPDGATLAVGGRPNGARSPLVVLIDADGGARRATWTGRQHAYALDLAYAPDGETVWVAGWGVEARDAATGALRFPVWEPTAPALAVAPPPHPGAPAAVAWQDQRVTLLDPSQRGAGEALPLRDAFTRALAWAPGGALLATSSTDGTVRLWEGLVERARLSGYDGANPGLAFSPDGAHLAAGSTQAPVRQWAFSALALTSPWEGRGSLWLSPTDGTVAHLDGDVVVLADPATGAERGRTSPLVLATPFATWAVGGGWLWTELVGGELGLVDAATLAVESVPPASPSRVLSVAARHAPGGPVAILHDDGTVALVAPGEPARWVTRVAPPGAGDMAAPPTSLTFSPDDDALYVAFPPAGIVRLGVADGAELAREATPRFAGRFMSWSADGRRLAAGAPDNAVLVVRSDDLTVEATLTGHSGPPWGATFSPAGDLLLTVSGDETSRLWRLPDGVELARVGRRGDFVWQGAFTDDGATLYTNGNDSAVRPWDLTALATPGEALLARLQDDYGLVLRGARIVPSTALSADPVATTAP